MMRLFASVGLLALIAAGPIAAADMPLKAAPAAVSWAGCYVGGTIGWIGGRDSLTLSPAGNYLSAAGPTAPPNAAGTGDLAGDLAVLTKAYGASGAGFTGGAEIGCNKQLDWLVVGVEADFDLTSLNEAIDAPYPAFTSANPAFTVSPRTEHVTNNLNWFSTLRVRAGYASDRWLAYATGGLAVANISSNTSVLFGTALPFPVYSLAQHVGSGTGTPLGLALGGGVEYALSQRWTLKAEYLYLNFGSFNYLSPLVSSAAIAAAGYAWNTVVADSDHIVRLGVNYRLGAN